MNDSNLCRNKKYCDICQTYNHSIFQQLKYVDVYGYSMVANILDHNGGDKEITHHMVLGVHTNNLIHLPNLEDVPDSEKRIYNLLVDLEETPRSN